MPAGKYSAADLVTAQAVEVTHENGAVRIGVALEPQGVQVFRLARTAVR